jgi:hypothetical protein
MHDIKVSEADRAVAHLYKCFADECVESRVGVDILLGTHPGAGADGAYSAAAFGPMGAPSSVLGSSVAGAAVEHTLSEDVQTGEETHRDVALLTELTRITGGGIVPVSGSFFRSANLAEPNGSLNASGVAAGMAADSALNMADAPERLASELLCVCRRVCGQEAVMKVFMYLPDHPNPDCSTPRTELDPFQTISVLYDFLPPY